MAEEKRFKELAHRDVIEWQRGVKRYSAPEYELQYEVWKKADTLPELAIDTAQEIKNPEFETYLVSPYWVRKPTSVVLEAAPSDAPSNAPEQPAQGA